MKPFTIATSVGPESPAGARPRSSTTQLRHCFLMVPGAVVSTWDLGCVGFWVWGFGEFEGSKVRSTGWGSAFPSLGWLSAFVWLGTLGACFSCRGSLTPRNTALTGASPCLKHPFFFPAVVVRFLARPHLLWETARAGARWQAQHVPVFSHES